MIGALAAFAFLIRRQARNRVAATFRRLKQPRYIIGLLAAAAYVWFFLIANPGLRRNPSAGQHGTPLFLQLMFVTSIVISWITAGAGKGGVAFREAEVEALFPAPLTRRQILVYKAMQLQTPLVVSGALVALVISRLGSLPWRPTFIAYWLAANVLSAHGMLMGLSLAALRRRLKQGPSLARLPGILLVLLLAFAFGAAWNEVGGFRGPAQFGALLEASWLGTLLRPVAALTRPFVAPPETFGAAILGPFIALVLHWVLVLLPDFQFEDQAIRIAQRIGRIRTEGLDALRDEPAAQTPRSGGFELAALGPAWRAIVWKNVRSVTRLHRRAWISILVSVTAMGFVVGQLAKGGGTDMIDRIGLFLLFVVSYGTLIAPAIVRVDLRIDIPHFDMIKSLPIRGRDLILGEIMGTVAVVFAVQSAILMLSSVLVRHAQRFTVTWDWKLPLLLAALVLFFAIDFALVGCENLMALWFPSLVRLGRGVRAGFDQFGQNILGAITRTFAIAIVMLLPGGLGVALFFALESLLGVAVPIAILAASTLAAALIVLEIFLLVLASSARYDRFDLSREQWNAAE